MLRFENRGDIHDGVDVEGTFHITIYLTLRRDPFIRLTTTFNAH